MEFGVLVFVKTDAKWSFNTLSFHSLIVFLK